jgi:hypothetical protein
MGASSLKVSLAKYTRTTVPYSKKPIEEITILADTVDETISG